MTPIQEIQIRLGNGDLVDCYIENESAHFASNWRLISTAGTHFEQSKTAPVMTASLAFESLLTAVHDLAGARETIVSEINNPCNDELVSRSQQEAQISKQGLNVRVLVNGQ